MTNRLVAAWNSNTTTLAVKASERLLPCSSFCNSYSTGKDYSGQEYLARARSTADEFLRQAKEKDNSASQRNKETAEDAKAAVAGGTKIEKKFKGKI